MYFGSRAICMMINPLIYDVRAIDHLTKFILLIRIVTILSKPVEP